MIIVKNDRVTRHLNSFYILFISVFGWRLTATHCSICCWKKNKKNRRKKICLTWVWELNVRGDEKSSSPLCNVLIISCSMSIFWFYSVINFRLFRVSMKWSVSFSYLFLFVNRMCRSHERTRMHNILSLRVFSVCLYFSFHFILCLDEVTSVCPAPIKIFEKKLKPEMMKLIMFFFSWCFILSFSFAWRTVACVPRA